MFSTMLSLRLIILFAFVLTLTKGHAFNDFGEDVNSFSSNIDDGPLFLTYHIEKGDIETAKWLSRCGDVPNAPPLLSYSGYITVNKDYNSNIFFWFFPAVNKDPDAPVLLWLQGGPGQSGLLGLFVEHGPYIIHANLTAGLREYHWARTFNMIYVDNPVGSGFSFTENEMGYATNQNEMADNMYEFLRQFFTLFHEYKDNEFYIAGESYAGKYVPSVAHKIHSVGTHSVVQLTGIMIGNGLCDPETMMKYSEFLYNIGVIDERQADDIKKLEDSIVEEIQNEDFYDAVNGFGKLHALYKIFTGMRFLDNFLLSEKPEDFSYYLDYVELPEFKRALKLGNMPFKDFGQNSVRDHLLLEFMKSAKPNITVIMNNYRVLIYNGQLDALIPYTSTVNFLKSVNWKYSDEYKRAERKIWYLKDSSEIAGYVHRVGDFYEVMIRNAGHEVAHDQPKAAFDLISRFVNKEQF